MSSFQSGITQTRVGLELKCEDNIWFTESAYFFLHQQSCWWTLFSDLDTEVRSGHKECTGQVEAFWIGSSHIENVFDSLRIFLRLFFSDSYSLTKLILQCAK